MLETAITIYEGITKAHDIYKTLSTLIIGDKKEQYLEQIATDMKDMKIHIERLSDQILYAVNLDSVQAAAPKEQHYLNELREIRQLIEPIQQALKQPILSSAMIKAPPLLESGSIRERVINRSPLKYATIIVDAPDWAPVLYKENGEYWLGWQQQKKFPHLFGCEYHERWQPNHQTLPKSHPLDLGTLLDKKGPETKPPQSGQLFDFEIVTVNAKGKITQRENKQARYQTEDLGKGVLLEMVSIAGGTFTMGSTEDKSEKPPHSVTVKPFYMSKYPVTQAQWEAVMGNNPSGFKGTNRPVENVSWDDANEFCQRLSKKTGKSYRLPSEAEWEYACRAGTSTPFYFGETITTELANYDGNHTYGSGPKGEYREQTTEVGKFPPNSFGLYDMHGNVWEWCADPWHTNYDDAPTDGSIWTKGGEDPYRLLRGGSWNYFPYVCRCAFRLRYPSGLNAIKLSSFIS